MIFVFLSGSTGVIQVGGAGNEGVGGGGCEEEEEEHGVLLWD